MLFPLSSPQVIDGIDERMSTDEDVVNGKWSNGKCYDLSGRHISVSSMLPKGVYIINGKKIVVK
jgi:hypothetical protein